MLDNRAMNVIILTEININLLYISFKYGNRSDSELNTRFPMLKITLKKCEVKIESNFATQHV